MSLEFESYKIKDWPLIGFSALLVTREQFAHGGFIRGQWLNMVDLSIMSTMLTKEEEQTILGVGCIALLRWKMRHLHGRHPLQIIWNRAFTRAINTLIAEREKTKWN